MSLIDDDVIIPNTLGIITMTARENNILNEKTTLAGIIRSSDQIYNIANGRANGIKLQELVDAKKISNDVERIEEREEERNTVYESWFKDRYEEN